MPLGEYGECLPRITVTTTSLEMKERMNVTYNNMIA